MEKLKIFTITLILIVVIIISSLIFQRAWDAYFLEDLNNKEINIHLITSGVTVAINTGNIISGEIYIPEEPREYLDYILEYGVEGEDFMAVEPPKQPVIRSVDKEENNKVKNSYFARNRITFNISDTDRTPYIMIVTNKAIPNTRDFFLGVDGISLGAIRKEKSLVVFEDNEYLYPLYGITKAGYNGQAFDVKSHVRDGKLDLNVFVGEAGNYVEKIIIFFK